ncbi:MAG: glycosyltransferase family 2 protein [Anaerolineaceae bacterium]|jgi:glycosyltransferase involved in cell wall biosynthesis
MSDEGFPSCQANKKYIDDTILRSSSYFPDHRADGSPWPKITVITPSFNQVEYIEETILSVLSQNYPNLEYVIIDGGSTDGTIDIIKEYEKSISWWVSEKDRGQSHAINKGLKRSTGDYVAWLNSDDFYLPDTLKEVAKFTENPDWIHGSSLVLNELTGEIKHVKEMKEAINEVDACFKNGASVNFSINQPSHFWSRKMLNEVGLLDESFHYCMDREWMYRALSLGFSPFLIPKALSCQRFQSESKTVSKWWKFDFEQARIYKSLSQKRLLARKPSMNMYKRIISRAHKSLSDVLYAKEEYINSSIHEVIAFCYSQEKNRMKFRSSLGSRVRQILKRISKK